MFTKEIYKKAYLYSESNNRNESDLIVHDKSIFQGNKRENLKDMTTSIEYYDPYEKNKQLRRSLELANINIGGTSLLESVENIRKDKVKESNNIFDMFDSYNKEKNESVANLYTSPTENPPKNMPLKGEYNEIQSGLTRSNEDFEEARYNDNNSSFIKINEQDSYLKLSNALTSVYDNHGVGKEELMKLISIYNTGFKKAKSIRRGKSIKKKEKVVKTKESGKYNNFIKSIKFKSKNNNENLIQILNVNENENEKEKEKWEDKGEDKEKEIININQNQKEIDLIIINNKFWTNLDAAFDSQKDPDVVNIDGFEEENELFNFNVSDLRDREYYKQTSIKSSKLDTYESIRKENMSQNEQEVMYKYNDYSDDEDFVYTSRNRQLFSVFNKNKNSKNQNTESLKVKQVQFDSIKEEKVSESVITNVIQKNINIMISSQIKQKTNYVIDHNLSNSIIEKVQNKDFRISYESKFEIESNKEKSKTLSLAYTSHNFSPERKVDQILNRKTSESFHANLNDFIIEERKKGNTKFNLDAFQGKRESNKYTKQMSFHLSTIQSESQINDINSKNKQTLNSIPRPKRNKNLMTSIDDNLNYFNNKFEVDFKDKQKEVDLISNNVYKITSYSSPITKRESNISYNQPKNFEATYSDSKEVNEINSYYKKYQQKNIMNTEQNKVSSQLTTITNNNNNFVDDSDKPQLNTISLNKDNQNTFRKLNVADNENEDNEDFKKINKNRIFGEINKHQYVVLQKNLPYRKNNLDLIRKSKVQNKNEVLYNNIADFTTISHLINSVKKACIFQKYQIKNHHKSPITTTPNTNNNNNNNNNFANINKPKVFPIMRVNGHINSFKPVNKTKSLIPDKKQINIISKSKSPVHTNKNNKSVPKSYKVIDHPNKNNTNRKNSISPDRTLYNFNEPIKENILIELLEELKQRNQQVQIYFNDKEHNLNKQIFDLNENLKSKSQREASLLEEIEVLRIKLAFFMDDFNIKRREREYDNHNNNNNKTASAADHTTAISRRIFSNEDTSIDSMLNQNTHNKRDRPKFNLNVSHINDLGDFNTEEKFVHKHSVPKLKSYMMMLKEIGLDMCTFYDDGIINIRDLEDDLCSECFTTSRIDDKCSKEKWNYKSCFEKQPKLKIFLELLAKKLKYDNKCRLKLEEKTLKIFCNDLKAIDQLDHKVKQLSRRGSLKIRANGNATQSSINRSCEFITHEYIEI